MPVPVCDDVSCGNLVHEFLPACTTALSEDPEVPTDITASPTKHPTEDPDDVYKS